MSWGFAGCTVCKDEPLVMTFQFYKREFICLGCGRTFEFFGPKNLGEGDELQKKSDERTAEWAENAGSKLLVGHVYHEGCETCRPSQDEYHSKHATAEEWVEHNNAVRWLTGRTGKDFSNLLKEAVAA
jgi:hypothetical protein